MNTKFRVLLVFLGLFTGAASAWAAPLHDPQSLGDVAAAVADHSGPVVVFDLDDTLFDSRTRTVRILRQFGALATIQVYWPDEAQTLRDAEIQKVTYRLEDTFKRLGITDPDFIKAAQGFWKERFFTDAYVQTDAAVPGASEYVRKLYDNGATIVYLTGRDSPSMGEGTKRSLAWGGFPLGHQAQLMMKPSKEMDDLAFKKTAIAEIAKLGQVVGVFENEPKNLNALSAAFPTAIPLFLNTQHSGAPEEPSANARWVRDYLY